ncbi:MAG: hypothetical protein JW704_02025 [Anaerolineaceae bacterium]|nr:hypothetical protein [Anaerolineaceae bacterium]
MTQQPAFDQQAAHQFFSAACFNQAWDLMEKADRTPEEDEQMIRLSLASHYHWTQRSDYSLESESIAYWQTSRIYTLLAQAGLAYQYAEKSLAASRRDGERPFFMGYSYEALARAEAIGGNQSKMMAALSKARHWAEKISDSDDRKALLADLDTVKIK